MRKAILGLGFFLLIACSGESTTPDSGTGSAAASGDEANGGSTANPGGGTSRGGNADTGGTSTGGVAAGGSPSGGASQAGSAGTGDSSGGDVEGGEGGAPSGTGGMATAGSGATSGGSSGSGPSTAVCDPDTGELDATPYPDCEPRDLADPCELCIQEACCAESKTCYGYEPENVCGWGGPTTGIYAGLSEIDCYVACVRDYVNDYGVYDDATDIACVPTCTTTGCGLIGNATQDLVVCLRENCDDECFAP